VRIASFAVAGFASWFLLFAGAAPAQAGTLDRVRQTGKLKLGYRIDARPFSYRDPSGHAVGFAVSLCAKVADDAKVELRLPTLAVEFVPLAMSEAEGALQQGRIDLLCGAVPTLARRREVSFSVPVFASGIGALLRTDAPTRLKDVLSGRETPSQPTWRASAARILETRVFSVVASSRAESALLNRLKELRLVVKVVPVKDYAAGIANVAKRRSDVFFADRAILLDAAAHSASARNLTVLDRFFTHETMALALQRGDEDFRLLVDRSLSRLLQSKEIVAIYATYFGKPDEDALTFFQLSALPE
jgi:ABC-type amino acid transport substrate-binding protein